MLAFTLAILQVEDLSKYVSCPCRVVEKKVTRLDVLGG
jgi:hypothetical protein